ncbi:hypothetical protein Tco_0950619 [Tanacetum coccineum]
MKNKGRQDCAFEFGFFNLKIHACQSRDDLEKIMRNANDISQRSVLLICHSFKKVLEKDASCIISDVLMEKAGKLREDKWVLSQIGSGKNTPSVHAKIKMSYLVPLIAVVFVVVVGCYLASVPQKEDHQYIIVILGLIVPLVIVAIGVEVFWKK